ncbi:MAG: TMEM165/GDT1 family protein [Candidatus Nanopelagicales bacterium]|nr:TMEM165/GDT1 family protein [Candidatus Nanopelagicales bacterium]MCF8556437.1 TMEM165/GDT1 family protein [Candidatus Nanopelagicales bacterium]
MIDVAVIATTFALILPAELPDKTFIATLVLATRFRHLWVWLGVAAAFLVQVLIAVTAGSLLTLLPQRIVLGATFLLFVVGAVIMIKGGLASRASELAAQQEEADDVSERMANETALSPLRTMGISFIVLFTAEWGDLSQLLTAGLAARTGQPVSVFIGSWVALLVVSGVAVLAGSWLRTRVPIWRIRLVSGGILTLLALWTAYEFINA